MILNFEEEDFKVKRDYFKGKDSEDLFEIQQNGYDIRNGKVRSAISSMYQSIEELEETNTPTTLIQKLMNNVQEVLDTLEEALFFSKMLKMIQI